MKVIDKKKAPNIPKVSDFSIYKREFFQRDPVEVAIDLVGSILVRTDPAGEQIIAAAKIVEVEAYRSDDPACHTWRKGGEIPPKESRSFQLFGEPGKAYIYLNYGVHWLLNVIAHREGEAGAVLFRAVEPILGLEFIKKNRPKIKKIHQLTDGPGKLTKALAIDGKFNGKGLITPPLFLAKGKKPKKIAKSQRIGISKGKELLWRFFIPQNPFLSKK